MARSKQLPNKAHAHPSNRQIEWPTLTAISLTNFKRFRHLPTLPLKPLTFLTGPNSAGKSTLIQALVFLKQSLEGSSRDQFIFNDLVNLGSFERTVCDGAKPLPPTISIVVEISVAAVTQHIRRDLGIEAAGATMRFDIRQVAPAQGEKPTPRLTALSIAISKEDGRPEDIISFTPLPDRPRWYKARALSQATKEHVRRGLKGAPFSVDLDNLTAEFRRFLPYAFLFPAKGKRLQDGALNDIPLGFVSPLISFLISQVHEELTRKLHYIGPLREEPEPLYPYSAKRIGVRGEHALAYLIANAKDHVPAGRPNGECGSLLDCVRNWIQQLGVSQKLDIKPHGGLYFEIQTDGHYLPEVGCGVGQLLPLVVQCLAAQEGETVLMEQPEIHLHQSLQAAVCDFLIAQLRRGVRIIAETHSEIMLQRLRRRIAESTDHTLHDRTAVHFFDSGEPMARQIEIDALGNVRFWPDSFFDQGMVEMRAMALAQMKKGGGPG